MSRPTVQITCPQCSSSIEIYPQENAKYAMCDICKNQMSINISKNLEDGYLDACPVCQTYDFYYQKDFNRKLGVGLFILASILSFWTYGISFIVLYIVDFILFKKLQAVCSCYKCSTLFRNIKNIDQIEAFDHEKNDRIIYSGHQFEKIPLQINPQVLAIDGRRVD